jgi:hypothetical protein
LGNPLEKIKGVIDFDQAVATKSIFPYFLESKSLNSDKKNNGRARTCDVVLIFKKLIEQR